MMLESIELVYGSVFQWNKSRYIEGNILMEVIIVIQRMGNCAGGDNKKDRQQPYYDQVITAHHTKSDQYSLKKMPCLKPSSSWLISSESEIQKQSSNFSLNFVTFYELIFAMERQLKENSALYKKYLDVGIVLQILQYFSKLYVAHEPAVEIVNIVLDFMAYCKNNACGDNKLYTRFTSQYLSELSWRWIKVRQSVYFFNKDHLRILNFIVSNPRSGILQYGQTFCDLKFSFQKEQVLQVAKIVKKMCEIDVRSFCFLSNYFYISCIAMQKQKYPIQKIQNEYLSALSLLGIQTNINQTFTFEDFVTGLFQSHRHQNLFPKIELDLTKYDKTEEKQFALDNFIMQRAMDSMQEFDKFNLLFKQICLKNDGFKYKSGVKIKNKGQTKALTRIKQKMLSTKFEQIELQRQLVSSIRDTFLQNFIDLYSFSSHEFSQFQKKMKSIFNKIDQPIPFKVTDMLRGKCVFSSIAKINSCCSDIVKMVESKADEGLQLFEIDNRLKKETSDLVVKIIIGSVVAQFQLVKEANIADYDFNHKIYELKRSKFFSPLTQLMILNEDLTKDYLLQAKALILANSIKKGFDYQQKISYDEPLQNFKTFSHLLSVKINYFETHSNEIDIKMIGLQQKRLRDILRYKVQIKIDEQQNFQQPFNNGVYYLSMKQYNQAIDQLETASNKFQQENQDLLQGFQRGLILSHQAKRKLQKYIKIVYFLGRTYEQMKNYNQAHEFYLKQLLLKQKTNGKDHYSIANTLNNIGNVYKMQLKYPKALQTYQKCLDIKQKSRKKDDIGIAATLNNIGEVYRSLSNFTKALEYYQLCLNIQEKVKGIQSMQTAATLNNIGLLYKNQGDYNKALQYFHRCLYLKQKEIGKESIGYVTTLNNIGNVYQSEGNYPKALQVYFKCLHIQERVNGKDSISIVTTLNNIGLVYSAQGNSDEALQYFERFIQIVERAKGKDSVDIAPALSNIGQTYKNQREYQKAIEYYIAAIRIYQKHNALYKSYAKCLTNLGDSYYKVNDISKAIQCFESAVEAYQKLNLSEQAKICRIHLTKCFKIISQVIKSRQNNQMTNQSRQSFLIKSL